MSEKTSKTKPEIPDLCGELLASLKVPRLEDENAALMKRAAELEEELFKWEGLGNYVQGPEFRVVSHEGNRAAVLRRIAALEDNLSLARIVIDNLKTQLAWAPVAEGLPTEPGRYQFIDDINFEHPDHGEFPHYWRKPKESPTEHLHWFLHCKRWFGSPLDWCPGYTYWRKVALPTRRITLPEAT